MLKKDSYFAYFLLFISYAIFGIYHPVQKQGLDSGYTPIEFAAASMFFASILLMPFAFREYKKHKLKINKKVIYEFLLLGFLATVLAPLLKLYGLFLTSANNVALITATSGIFITIIAYLLFKEKMPNYFPPVIIFMSWGIFLFKTPSFNNFSSFGIGDLCVFSFVIVISLSTNLAKKYMIKFPSILISSARLLFGLPLLFLLYFLFFEFNITRLFSFWPILAGFLFVLRVSTYYHALKIINIKEVALFAIVSPIITFAYSFLLFGETLNLIQIVGVLIVFLGIYIHVVMKSKTKKNNLDI